jgi:hypothetical protein
MRVRLALLDPTRRWVLRMPRARPAGDLRRRCLVLHGTRPEWGRLLAAPLRWLGLTFAEGAQSLDLSGGRGRVAWSDGRLHTWIDIEVREFSPRMQGLIEGALINAARCGREEDA